MGPTALGKTAIAVELAERLSAEIVSADSMQVYRGLPLLTNQPSADQAARVRHHLTGFVPPSEEFSVAEYSRLAQAAIDSIRARRRRVVVEGGSGLYVRAALGGLSFGAPPDAALRRRLAELTAREGLTALLQELRRRDAATAATIDAANPRRLLRALETVMAQGAPLAPEQRLRLWSGESSYVYRLVALDDEREALRRRVDERVEAMVAAGVVEELRALRGLVGLSRTLQQAIGVREFGLYLDGALSLDEATAQTKARTRRYVRRQLTWMRKLPDAVRIAVTGRSPSAVADDIVGRLLAPDPAPEVHA